MTLGEILVEIMADEPGTGFLEPLRLTGPYPSGAPAIFIDQVARLGHPAALIGAVGDDDFGRMTIDRLRRDGVDVSAVVVDRDHPTGTAFVRYRPDGSRDFVFNVRRSASGQTRPGPAANLVLDRASHLHVMGSSLFSPALAEAMTEAVDRVKRRGGTISFDPNIRKEMLAAAGVDRSLRSMLERCDLFLPSGEELTLLTDATDPDEAIAAILGLGVGAIVVKHGARGATYHDRSGSLSTAPFPSTEIDPTGAGDCFGATFVACRSLGHAPDHALRYAAASGALAVRARGPMEGTSGFAALDALIASGRPR